MRYIFMDEAGTSAHEPVTVVVGVIANADQHVQAAELAVQETLGAVPNHLKDDFVFHATQVFGDKKYHGGDWLLTDRLELLKSMMMLPRKMGMSLAVSCSWRGQVDYSDNLARLGLSAEQCDHFLAFADCVCKSDEWIRKTAGQREVASIVAEDVPQMRSVLKDIPKMRRAHKFHMPASLMRRTVSDIERGYISQSGDYRVTRIRNSVHFVEKAEDPLIQLADACAYGIRRYFAKESFGIDFVDAIFGSESALKDFGPPSGVSVFGPRPNPEFLY